MNEYCHKAVPTHRAALSTLTNGNEEAAID